MVQATTSADRDLAASVSTRRLNDSGNARGLRRSGRYRRRRPADPAESIAGRLASLAGCGATAGSVAGCAGAPIPAIACGVSRRRGQRAPVPVEGSCPVAIDRPRGRTASVRSPVRKPAGLVVGEIPAGDGRYRRASPTASQRASRAGALPVDSPTSGDPSPGRLASGVRPGHALRQPAQQLHTDQVTRKICCGTARELPRRNPESTESRTARARRDPPTHPSTCSATPPRGRQCSPDGGRCQTLESWGELRTPGFQDRNRGCINAMKCSGMRPWKVRIVEYPPTCRDRRPASGRHAHHARRSWPWGIRGRVKLGSGGIARRRRLRSVLSRCLNAGTVPDMRECRRGQHQPSGRSLARAACVHPCCRAPPAGLCPVRSVPDHLACGLSDRPARTLRSVLVRSVLVRSVLVRSVLARSVLVRSVLARSGGRCRSLRDPGLAPSARPQVRLAGRTARLRRMALVRLAAVRRGPKGVCRRGPSGRPVEVGAGMHVAVDSFPSSAGKPTPFIGLW